MASSTYTVHSPIQGVPEHEVDTCQYVMSCVITFENGIGQDFKANCEKYYRLYRGFKEFKNSWEAAGPNDRDGVVFDAQKTWGANLHIPMTFRTIEVMVPRAIAQRPRMLILPRDERWEQNVQNVRLMIDAQQEQIDIELRYQDVMRAGMIYGLGVGKSFWREEYIPRQRMEANLYGAASDGSGHHLGDLKMHKIFDDPDFEGIDVFDFAWDPAGADMDGGTSRRCRWAGNRMWMDDEQCLDRIESGAWNTVGAKLLTSDLLEGMGSSQKYTEIWQARMQAAGLPSFDATGRHRLHEVWEWHDGHRVITILDRQLTVVEEISPAAGMLPYHTYRPTRVPNELVGIGEIEPMQHLQRELDMLRSQRRDAATIALCTGYAYDKNAIDEEDLVFGPAIAIPVRNSDPQNALFPLPKNEVPGSGYQEEQAIKSDIDSVTGINDALAGGDGGAIGTATEAQLVQAAVSKRIEMKSRRFEVEVVRGSARCFMYLNQRKISEDRKYRQPAKGYTPAEAAMEGRWEWFKVGPGEMMGEFEFIPEGGSMAAENVPQNRQDAQMIMNMFGQNPFIDPRQPLLKALTLAGVKNPETWLKQQEAPIPPSVLQKLVEDFGVDPDAVKAAVAAAQNEDPMLNPEGPAPAPGETAPDQGAQQAEQVAA